MTDAGEIIRSGAADKLADIIHKLAGPMADEIGLLMADRIKIYRVRNWVKVVQKTQKILADAHLSPSAVPPRLFLPILEGASIEDDETLQGLWAGLLGSASEQSDSLSPSFIETLKQLSPSEARALDGFFEDASKVAPHLQGNAFVLPPKMFTREFRPIVESFERLGIVRKEYGLHQKNPLMLLPSEQRSAPLAELTSVFLFTEYGIQFVKACRGPRGGGEIPSDPNLLAKRN